MDLPKPPDEPEVKNIIDKLANFVARNGIAFERMTKDKQKNNPKFAFLFGGQHYNYYQYKLSTEQQILNQQRSRMSNQGVQDVMVQQSLQNAPWQQQQGNFGLFPPGPPPQLPPNMPAGPQPIPPWQQQSMAAPWQQSHPSNVPVGGPPPGMHGGPPSGGIHGPPPGGPGLIGVPSMQPPSNVAPNASGPTPLMMTNPEPTGLVKQESDLEKEEGEVQKKIQDSENNLRQQHDVLMVQEKDQIQSSIYNELNRNLKCMAMDNNVSLDDFDKVVQPIIDSCTKDSIASGKSWILSNAVTEEKCTVVARHLLWKVTDARRILKSQRTGTIDKKLFETQLHLIYLINDVLHHASRRNLSDLSKTLEAVIVPIFSMTQSCASEQNQQRLSKLLGLWGRFNYFSENTASQLAVPEKALSDYESKLEEDYSNIVQQVKASFKKQYEQFEKQHKDYANHLMQQVEKKRIELEDQKRKQHQPVGRRSEYGDRSSNTGDQQYSERDRSLDQNMDERWQRNYDNEEYSSVYVEDYDNDGPPDEEYNDNRPRRNMDYGGQQHSHSDWQNDQRGEQEQWSQGDEQDNWDGDRPGPFRPDNNPNWSNEGAPPPLGSNGRPMGGMPHDDPSLIPKVPYYDLPAGLMAPLVNLEDMDYKELDPSLIRLPPPIPPSDRLLAAVEAFYGPPSHERPRNPEGWEHNGLFEFFRAKVRAKRRVQQGRKDSKSRSRSRDRRSYSRSHSRSSSRSGSSSRSRSSRSRSRSNSRSPGRRPTPPSFGPAYYQQNVNMSGRLSDENRGAQMMKKMGWGGAGLGSSEQGRQDPVEAGDVRDKYDQFKGLGMDMNDPYDNFRKNRSYGYGPRMRGKD